MRLPVNVKRALHTARDHRAAIQARPNPVGEIVVLEKVDFDFGRSLRQAHGVDIR